MKAIIAAFAVLTAVFTASAQAPKSTGAAKTVAIISIPEEATTSPSTLAKWLKAHTGSQQALQQALFNWMAGHIAYDVDNMNRVSSYRDSAAAMLKTLQTRKGLCTDYAVLYAQVCKEAGITAIVVTGYALAHDIMVPTGSHDWVVVKNGNQWTITDPTWGAGAVDNGRFIQRTNWTWFQASPQIAVKTHMPYDPMWQMLSFPLRHDELGSGAFAAAAKRPVFAYGDTLQAWFRQSRLERLQKSSARIRRFGGAANPFIMTELDWMDQSIRVLAGNQEIEARNRRIDQFNALNREYTEIVKSYNEYVGFKNRQFLPEVQDAALRKMIDGIAGRLSAAEASLSGLKSADDGLKQNMEELGEAISGLKGKVGDEQTFVGKYLKTEKAKRRELFYVQVADKL
ncbi:transglutaminase domain-containing protein [Chitinophaga arvensicola]|uniref:Transglutaminase-like superfamily protein n=1 Tax=Chitinophaga arvensicola TaxID=29529 RepID=A0A1I0SCN9_9BACT|nr:transglutaminase domain-containing protein [Chitinophaga arvensicola]SEW55272.1 Transglutaminase-like superfamily protein [Chitinophaga arvensicola]